MKQIQLQNAAKNPGHYSPGMITGNTLYVSGQLPVRPEDRSIPQGLRAQVIQCLDNVETVLKEAGFSRKDIVMCRVYLSDIDAWDELNAVYGEWFGDHKPARVVVPVPALHYGALVEIEAVAELG